MINKRLICGHELDGKVVGAGLQEFRISHWYRHLGSTVCLILGTISFTAGLSRVPAGMETEGTFMSGTFMILGAITYRSAKKRRLQEVISTVPRKFVEVGLLISVLVLTQNNLIHQMTTHPVLNLGFRMSSLLEWLCLRSLTSCRPAHVSASIAPRWLQANRPPTHLV
jgi:hypothetical protein